MKFVSGDMNAVEIDSKFVPKQAASPTPQLYDELVADTMEKLAAASIAHVLPLSDGDILHDTGCGTGVGTIGTIEISTACFCNRRLL